MPYRATRSNHVVRLDVTFIRDSQGCQPTLLKALYDAPMYIFLLRCDSSIPSDVVDVFKENLVTWAAIPETIVVDNGSVFGYALHTSTPTSGIFSRVIPA